MFDLCITVHIFTGKYVLNSAQWGRWTWSEAGWGHNLKGFGIWTIKPEVWSQHWVPLGAWDVVQEHWCQVELVPPARHGMGRELGCALSESKASSFVVYWHNRHWLGNDTAQTGGPERHLKAASFQGIIFPLMKEINDKWISILCNVEAKDPNVGFSPCRQIVPGPITQCCLSLPAVPSSCNVSTMQVASLHACGDRELGFSDLLVPSRNGTRVQIYWEKM